MRVIEQKQNWGKDKLLKFIEWLIHIFAYTLVFLGVSLMFKSFYIDTSHYCIYGFLAVIIMYILNKTIKPILVTLTIPITGITLGLFYPFINVFILKLTDWILGSHFQLSNFYVAIVIAILISIMNLLVEGFILKPLMRRWNRHE